MAYYVYHNHDYGFAPTDPPVDDPSDNDLRRRPVGVLLRHGGASSP